jgi:hypothetical protein
MKRRIVLEDSEIHTPVLTMRSAKELQAGKAAMKAKCKAVALAETPAAVRLVYPITGRGGNGWPSRREMLCPRPFTRRALFYFLRECGRVALNLTSQDRKEKWKRWNVETLTAEKWARDRMRAHGLPVPRKKTH